MSDRITAEVKIWFTDLTAEDLAEIEDRIEQAVGG